MQHFALTWAIPENYGGLTASMFTRSALLASNFDTEVTAITLDNREFPATTAATLTQRSALRPGVQHINLYEWLRSNPLPAGKLQLDKHRFQPLSSTASDVITESENGNLLRLVLLNDADKAVQIDHFRADGSLLLTDTTVNGKRHLVLCDETGTPVRSWGSVWGLYRAWLDTLIGSKQATIIVDSKAVAKFIASYRRENVRTIHYIHGVHHNPDGTIRPSRQPVFTQLNDYDAIVFPTRKQCNIAREQFPSYKRFFAIAPAYRSDLQPQTVTQRRVNADPVRVASVGRLEPGKRHHLAIDAVAAANRHPSASRKFSLDIYGSGNKASELAKLAQKHPGITVCGQSENIAREFAEHDFLLVTSAEESFAMTILEAFTAGCIPIAFDVPYGPGELITHGQNGFLVPDGDTAALSDMLLHATTLPDTEIQRLRQNAMQRARDFTADAVANEWQKCINAVWSQQLPPLAAQKSFARLLRSKAKEIITSLAGRG